VAALALLLITAPAIVECSNPAGTRLLHHRRSAFNEIWVVEDLQGVRRCLQFAPDGGLQSCMVVADPTRLLLTYTRSMVAALALADSPRRVLLVGLGGASIPRFLARFLPALEVDVVEIDGAVIDVATTYFAFRSGERMRVHLGDGSDFLARSERSWDVIMVDATDSDSVPAELVTAGFFAAVAAHLAPGGVAVMNLLAPAGARSTAGPIRAFDQVFPSAAALLPEVTRAARKGLLPGAYAGAAVNHILVARTGGIPVSCADWAVAGARFTSEHGLQDELGRLVEGECVPLADLSLVGGVP
jgi:spermidine synthase